VNAEQNKKGQRTRVTTFNSAKREWGPTERKRAKKIRRWCRIQRDQWKVLANAHRLRGGIRGSGSIGPGRGRARRSHVLHGKKIKGRPSDARKRLFLGRPGGKNRWEKSRKKGSPPRKLGEVGWSNKKEKLDIYLLAGGGDAVSRKPLEGRVQKQKSSTESDGRGPQKIE